MRSKVPPFVVQKRNPVAEKVLRENGRSHGWATHSLEKIFLEMEKTPPSHPLQTRKSDEGGSR